LIYYFLKYLQLNRKKQIAQLGFGLYISAPKSNILLLVGVIIDQRNMRLRKEVGDNTDLKQA